MKKILLPTDFSDNAWNAIFASLKLFSDVECQFYLLHAYEPSALNMLGRKGQQRLGTIYDSLAQNSNQELQKVLNYLSENHKNNKHIFESVSKSASLSEAVSEMVALEFIDFIVMGTQGATGAKQVFLGSNTVKILRQIDSCPILVVPNDYDFKVLKTLLFPTDYSKKFKKYQVAPMHELALLWRSCMEVVHVAVEFALNEQQQTNQKLLREWFEGIQVTFRNIDFEVDVAYSLETFISNTEADLIAMIRYHHSFWENVIGEAVVKKLAFHTKVPLLILPE